MSSQPAEVGAFRCPQCGQQALRVINSRGVNGQYRRRRYLCRSCSHRFSSIEQMLKEEIRGDEEALRSALIALVREATDDMLLLELRRRLIQHRSETR